MSTKLSDKEVANARYTMTMDTVALRCSYYRANPQRFCEDYLNIHLKLFQQIRRVDILCLADGKTTTQIVCALSD